MSKCVFPRCVFRGDQIAHCFCFIICLCNLNHTFTLEEKSKNEREKFIFHLFAFMSWLRELCKSVTALLKVFPWSSNSLSNIWMKKTIMFLTFLTRIFKLWPIFQPSSCKCHSFTLLIVCYGPHFLNVIIMYWL